LWKLLLLPFALLFAVSLHLLTRRLARGLEPWVVGVTLFSPAFLPSMNYMQDVPALSLGLGALALYLHAEERGSALRAIAAGLVAGLAMQTKWTQFTIPAAMLLHGLLAGRLLLPVLAAGAAALVFGAWEALMTARYGHGMFLFQLDFPFFWTTRSEMVVPLLRLVGALLPVPALLGLAASGVPRSVVLALALALLGGWVALLAWPIESQLYLVSGLVCALALMATAAGSISIPGRSGSVRTWISARRVDLFLIGWCMGEVSTYFAISYFPAVRRVLALGLVATLLTARAAVAASWRQRALPFAPLLALQATLGLAVWGVDLLEARAQREAATAALAAVRTRDARASVWFVGHWGFQFYAESLGMRPLIPDYTRVGRGEWLVVPTRVDQQEVVIAPAAFELATIVRVPSYLPLASTYGIYVGSTPLEHFRGPRVEARVYRALRDVVPESAWPLAQVAEWAMHAGGEQAGWATRALARELMRSPAPAERALAAEALAALGNRLRREPGTLAALERAASSDPSPAVREAASQVLAKLLGPSS
jgi:hypothetical protein